ncbi:MAG: hypothetical protein ACE5FU_14155 [Nitrospinota bacterium]
MFQMTLRERVSLLVGGVFFAGALYLYLFYFPITENISRLRKMIANREIEIEKIRTLSQEYLSQKKQFSSVEKRVASVDGGFSSLTYIETIAEKSGLHDNITAINPQPTLKLGQYKGTTHEIRIENVDLSKIVEYIYFFENSEYLLKIDRLVLEKRYGVKNKFNARVVVVSFEKA